MVNDPLILMHKICQDFPKIMKDPVINKDGKFFWNIECGVGWWPLVYSMLKEIQDYLDANPVVEQVVASQVKEKYGHLRFYYSGGDKKINDIVEKYCQHSILTCEICGRPAAERKRDMPIAARCSKCSAKL